MPRFHIGIQSAILASKPGASFAVCLLFVSLAACDAFAHEDQVNVPVDEIRSGFAKRYPANGAGAVVGVYRDGQTMMQEGFGLADVAKKTKLDADGVFDLASMSKQFTAVALLLLVDRGKIALDDPIAKHLRELKGVCDANDPVRVRHLLQQTTGFQDYLGFWRGDDAKFSKTTNVDFMRELAKQKRTFAPGTRFEYSNSNYILPPIIIQRVDGRAFSEFVKAEIFDPLQMKSSMVFDRVDAVVPNRVQGYTRKWFGFGALQPSRKDGPTCGDGNVFCSLKDLSRWAKALDERKLLKPETWDMAWTAGVKADEKRGAGYGCGWVLDQHGGRKRIWHNGGWAGTSTMMIHYPAEKLSIFVLCNSDVADATGEGMRIAERCFK